MYQTHSNRSRGNGSPANAASRQGQGNPRGEEIISSYVSSPSKTYKMIRVFGSFL